MKNIYKKIARKIFMNAFHDELVEINQDIRQASKNRDMNDVNRLTILGEVIGKINVLEKLDLLS
jgi:hypothetical protein